MKIVPVITDSYYITYGVFYLMGMLVYVPFHIFINAYMYWNFKFQEPCTRDPSHPCPPDDVPPPPPVPPGPPRPPGPPDDPGPPLRSPHPVTLASPPERNVFQKSFSSSFYMTSHITLFTFLVLTVYFSKKMPAPVKRISGALVVMCALCAVSTVLTQIDLRKIVPKLYTFPQQLFVRNMSLFHTCYVMIVMYSLIATYDRIFNKMILISFAHNSGVQLFFWISILLVIIINFCSAISIISLYELVTIFPVSYYASIMSGQSICGIVAVLIQLVLIGIRLPAETNGSVFFALGTAITLATTVFYLFLMRRSQFFIYTIQDHSGDNRCRRVDVKTLNRDKMASVLHRMKWYYASLVLVQGSTAMIHPGFTSLVISDSSGTTWSDEYFTPVISYLIFHVCNLIGRESAKIVKTPKNGMVIMVPSVIRVALVPLMIFCNAQPRSHMPVYFGDSTFIMLIGLIAFSEGVLINISILAIPSVVSKDEIKTAMVLIPCFSLVTVALCSGVNMVINTLI